MKLFLKSLAPKPFWKVLKSTKEKWFTNYARDAYSQEGEDLILERLFAEKGKRNGFYVDIGALHPKRYSNTYLLYKKGWRGINVDANPGSMAEFRRIRPRDINIEAAITSGRETRKFHIFYAPEMNTFDPTLAQHWVEKGSEMLGTVDLRCMPLADLLDTHVPNGTAIDLLTVDVEGFDYEVLSSNNWRKYRPEFIIAECLDTVSIDQAHSDPVAKLLMDHGYLIAAKTMNSVIFRTAT